MTTNDDSPTETATSAVSENPMSLDQTFLYQDGKTGSPSKSPLTIRQLCRLINTPAVTHVTSDTQLLGMTPEGSFESEWRPAKTIPILKQACAQWYYVEGTKTEGPVSCRALAEHLHAVEPRQRLATRVYSEATSGWTTLHDEPDLQMALESFDTLASSKEHAPTVANAGNDEEATAPATTPIENDAGATSQQVQDELEAFLKSTVGTSHEKNDSMEEHGYESDGGTRYVKDPLSGNWIHEALVPAEARRPKAKPSQEAPNETSNPKKVSKKRKKPKFSLKNAKCWVYVTGLPSDTHFDEVATYFSKAGILDLDPETQRPKIKLYRHEDGRYKGDASIAYARPESVELALQLLDEAPFRGTECPLRVERAKFEQRGERIEKHHRISNAQRKVARLAAIQALDWDGGNFNGRLTGGRKGLRIIVLQHMFHPDEDGDDESLSKLEQSLHKECETKWGTVEKITIFSKNPRGVVVVKFAQPAAASDAVKELNGCARNNRRIMASFWDGVTDFTVKDEHQEERETKQRHEEFGNWLNSQDLPEELQLQVEQES